MIIYDKGRNITGNSKSNNNQLLMLLHRYKSSKRLATTALYDLKPQIRINDKEASHLFGYSLDELKLTSMFHNLGREKIEGNITYSLAKIAKVCNIQPQNLISISDKQ